MGFFHETSLFPINHIGIIRINQVKFFKKSCWLDGLKGGKGGENGGLSDPCPASQTGVVTNIANIPNKINRLVLNQALSGINLLAILALIMIKSARIGK